MLAIAGVVAAFAQAPPSTPANTRPAVSASVRLEDWALFRSAAAQVLGWKVGIPASEFRQLTFSDAAAKVDALGLANIAGSNVQKFSLEIPKALDYKLAPGELEAVRDRLRALNMRMPAYFTADLGADDATSRKIFEFAKALGVETILAAADPARLPAIDQLANEIGINVALRNGTRDPKALLQAVEGHSKRIGVAVDSGQWIKDALLKDRILALHLRDPGMAEFVREMYRTGIKPSFVSVDAAAVDALETALHPVMAERVNEISRTAAIRGPDRLPAEERQKLEAALPQRAPAVPKKPRKLLVMDLNVAYGGHRSIPHANLAVELMGKRTGAYEAVFNNDLSNLKYPAIRQFDAIYLNNTVGMIFVEPEVREGLTRFVREG